MSNLPDFKQHCEAACIKLWGEPDRRTSKELRWNGGDAYGARTYDIRKHVWYDAGAERGGSIFDLIDYIENKPKRPKGGYRGAEFFKTWQKLFDQGLCPDEPPQPNGGTKWPIRDTYSYRDENNVVLFEVVRFDTADPSERFRQRQPDGKGGWIWKLTGVCRVLYRLPELIAAVKAKQLVLVTEGEKDANTAVKLGYVATTMPGGISKWRNEYDAFFRDADVVVVSDNDPQLKDPKTGKPQFHPNGDPILPGQDHAAKLAKQLSKVATRVRKIMFEVKDLTAWHEAGGTREQLDELITKATEPDPPDDDEIEKEVARLAALSDVEYDHARDEAAKKLGIRISTLDELVAQKRAQHDAGLEDKVALWFSAKYANNLRYVHLWGKWFYWNGVRWAAENTLFAFHLARELCRVAEDADHKTVAAVIGLARTDRRQAAETEQWDADIWLLGTPGGTVDLHTGKTSPPKLTDYITKLTAVAPSNDPPHDSCPLWLTFLNQAMNGDEALQDFLQRVCGYCLTGSVKEEALFFNYGKGANGKSVFMRTIAGILAMYHEAASMETFTVTQGEKHPTDLAQLRGARLVTAVEVEEGKRWAEAKLCQMTGGDPITARFMRQDFFTYTPQFKPMFAGNHKPSFRNVNEAIRRRMNLIPWLITIPESERDKELSDKLKPQWPGILRWMIDGCLMWQRDGLRPPKIVTVATKEYLESQDTLQNFFDDCCVIAKGEWDTFAHIWDGYVDWCEDCHEYIGSKKAFGLKLGDKGFQATEQGLKNTVIYLGIRCIRENAKKVMEEAKRKTEEARKAAPPDYEPE